MLTATSIVPFTGHDSELAHRWPASKAQDWIDRNGWIVGCNYIPGNAINQLEMWQETTFSPDLIDRELSMAAGLGFNSVRVFLHTLLWQENAEGFLNRIDLFLGIASKYGIRTMLVLFDSVWDPFPRLGQQPQPKPNVHNSGWVQCPGYDILNDPTRYEELRDYVQGIVGRFRNDERVLIWDLFNEPDNMNLSSYKDDDYSHHKAELSMLLLKKTINWVRVIGPDQPITMAPWKEDWSSDDVLTALDNYMFTHSDIISFHCYENRSEMESRIRALQRFGRPMLCTEYMARPFNNTFQEILPLLKKYNVGAYNWGLVEGKTQTHCPWDSWNTRYESEPELWFHDIFRKNGEPYIAAEIEFLKEITRQPAEKASKVA